MGRPKDKEGKMELELRVRLKDPRADVQAVKEALAYYFEQYGDLALISVEAVEERQESLWGGRHA